MRNKVVSVLLSCCLLLTGCSVEFDLPFAQKVTPEQLVSDGFGKLGSEDVIDADITMEMECTVDTDGYEFPVSIGVDLSVEMNESYAHQDGTIKVDAAGTNANEIVNVYFDISEGVCYTYDTASGTWYQEDTEFDKSGMSCDSSDFSELELKDRKAKEDYVVTGKIPVADGFGFGFDDTASVLVAEQDYEGLEFDVKLTFDADTKLIKRAEMSYVGDEDASVSVLNFSVTYNQVGGDLNLSIPRSVTDNIVSSDKLTYKGYTTDEVRSILIQNSELTEDDLNSKTDEEIIETISAAMKEADEVFKGVDGWSDMNLEEKLQYMEQGYDYSGNGSDVIVTPAEGVTATVESAEKGILSSDSLDIVIDGVQFHRGIKLSEFTDRGWYSESDSSASGYMLFKNDAYNGVQLLFSSDFHGEVTQADLEDRGIYGFSYGYFGQVKPPVSINGIDFDSGESDISNLFGEPYYYYDGETASNLEYKVDDFGEIGFDVKKETGALRKVTLMMY